MSLAVVAILISFGQLLLALAIFLRIDSTIFHSRKRGLADISLAPKPRAMTRFKLVMILIAGGFAFAAYGLYRTFDTSAPTASSPSQEQEIARLRATVKRFEDRASEETAREWPPLTEEEITKWADALRPFHFSELYVFWNQEVEARRLFASLKAVGQQAGIADVGTAFGGGTPGTISIETSKDDPAGLVLVKLFKTLTSSVQLTQAGDGRKAILVTIGERMR